MFYVKVRNLVSNNKLRGSAFFEFKCCQHCRYVVFTVYTPLAGFIRFCCWTGTVLGGVAWFIWSRALRGSCQVVVWSMWLRRDETVQSESGKCSTNAFLRDGGKFKTPSRISVKEKVTGRSWWLRGVSISSLMKTSKLSPAFRKWWLSPEATISFVYLDTLWTRNSIYTRRPQTPVKYNTIREINPLFVMRIMFCFGWDCWHFSTACESLFPVKGNLCDSDV